MPVSVSLFLQGHSRLSRSPRLSLVSSLSSFIFLLSQCSTTTQLLWKVYIYVICPDILRRICLIFQGKAFNYLRTYSIADDYHRRAGARTSPTSWNSFRTRENNSVPGVCLLTGPVALLKGKPHELLVSQCAIWCIPLLNFFYWNAVWIAPLVSY